MDDASHDASSSAVAHNLEEYSLSQGSNNRNDETDNGSHYKG